jgi:hypothetical protein
MRLRVSGQQTGHEYQLQSIMDGDPFLSGVPNDIILNAFVEAIHDRDIFRIKIARSAIVDEMGERAMVDAAATIAAFNAYPRMADSTGIPLEDSKKQLTSEMCEELGMEKYQYND